jgi:ABC-type phosphate transport system substrate-binding protein
LGASRATVVLLLLLLALGAAAGQPRPGFQVIVDPDNPVQEIDRKLLADIFLKKITRWGNDRLIRPVDAEAASPVRERFSEDVLERSVAAVKSYWQQLIFSGRGLPPPELDGDDEVVSYVLNHAGAVGYVSAGAKLGGAKVLVLR